jgi:hypothetical protein
LEKQQYATLGNLSFALYDTHVDSAVNNAKAIRRVFFSQPTDQPEKIT